MRRILLTALLLFFSLDAWAAPVIDDAGAAALKPRVTATIKLFADGLKQHGFTLNQQGELTVEPAGTYYAVTTPALTLAFPTGVTRTIGMIAINAIPTNNPDIIKVALAIPTPMLDAGPDGNPLGRITIANQSLSGLWHFAAASFVQLDARYADIAIADTLNGTETLIPALAMAMNLTDNGQGKWSGPSSVLASNITHKTKDAAYKLGQLQIKSSITGMDVTKRAKALEIDTEKKDAAPVTLDAVLAQTLSEIAEGFDSTLTVSDLSVSSNAQDGTASVLGIKAVTLASAMKGLLTSEPSSSWNVLFEGFTSNNQAAAPFMPTRVQIKGSSKGVALAELLAPKKDSTAMTAMAKEGSVSKLEIFVIDAPKYGLEASGDFSAGAKSMNGGVYITLRGFTDLLTWLSSPEGPSVQGKKLPASITGIMGMVQMMGKPGTDAQGRAVLTYDFKFTPEGKLMLNGADFSGMLGGGNATQAAPSSAPSVQAAP
ncbi:MAG: hypothetical protein EBQ96_06380 [Proteobacteria bacterium]|nr:hypothetical protein [Pseudomonadota bacterium]